MGKKPKGGKGRLRDGGREQGGCRKRKGKEEPSQKHIQ